MVKEEPKKDKLIAHHTKTGAGGDLAALDDTEDLGGARKSEYKAEPDMPEMSEESITRAATAAVEQAAPMGGHHTRGMNRHSMGGGMNRHSMGSAAVTKTAL